jgi:SAM-dependent methyltransferase
LETELFGRFFEVEDRHWWFVGRRRIVLDQLTRAIPRADACYPGGPDRHRRVLDIGCGTGGVLAHLGEFGKAYGIDPSPEASRYCHERGLPIALGSGMDLPYRDQTFEAVLALDVIEHVDDDVRLLREARRVLRPGGVAVLTVPALPWLWSSHDVVNHHYRRYVRSTLEAAVCAAGLAPEKVSYYNSLLLPLAVTRKVMHRMNGTGDHLESLPGPANGVLRAILGAEQPLIGKVDLPIGASLVCTARRIG